MDPKNRPHYLHVFHRGDDLPVAMVHSLYCLPTVAPPVDDYQYHVTYSTTYPVSRIWKLDKIFYFTLAE